MWWISYRGEGKTGLDNILVAYRARSCRSVDYHCRLLMVYEGRLATCDVPRSNVGIPEAVVHKRGGRLGRACRCLPLRVFVEKAEHLLRSIGPLGIGI